MTSSLQKLPKLSVWILLLDLSFNDSISRNSSPNYIAYVLLVNKLQCFFPVCHPLFFILFRPFMLQQRWNRNLFSFHHASVLLFTDSPTPPTSWSGTISFIQTRSQTTDNSDSIKIIFSWELFFFFCAAVRLWRKFGKWNTPSRGAARTFVEEPLHSGSTTAPRTSDEITGDLTCLFTLVGFQLSRFWVQFK